MSDLDSSPTVECTIDAARAAERAERVAADLIPAFAGATEHTDGVTVRFTGTDDTLSAVARFVAEEKECCAFADYRIDVVPPYEETRLTITGPEGTRAMFAEEFVPRLEGEIPIRPPD